MTVTFFVINNKTLFLPLRFLYPECEKLIEPHEQMYPLRCLVEDGCPANMQCMDFLVKRLNYLFTQVFPTAEMIITYYRYRDRPESLRGAVFDRDFSEPKVIILNRAAFRKFQREGQTYQWNPTDEYKHIGSERGIIPVEHLIRDVSRN